MWTLRRALLSITLCSSMLCLATHRASAEEGELVQSDNVGSSVWSHNFTSGKTTTIADAVDLSEFVGLHYFVSDDVRLGMNLQFGERVTPAPAAGISRFQTFALLPQVGWHLHRPFFVAGVPTFVLRSGGKNQIDLGFQVVMGAGFALGRRISASVAVEVPYYFKLAHRIGITPLVGLSWKI